MNSFNFPLQQLGPYLISVIWTVMLSGVVVARCVARIRRMRCQRRVRRFDGVAAERVASRLVEMTESCAPSPVHDGTTPVPAADEQAVHAALVRCDGESPLAARDRMWPYVVGITLSLAVTLLTITSSVLRAPPPSFGESVRRATATVAPTQLHELGGGVPHDIVAPITTLSPQSPLVAGTQLAPITRGAANVSGGVQANADTAQQAAPPRPTPAPVACGDGGDQPLLGVTWPPPPELYGLIESLGIQAVAYDDEHLVGQISFHPLPHLEPFVAREGMSRRVRWLTAENIGVAFCTRVQLRLPAELDASWAAIKLAAMRDNGGAAGRVSARLVRRLSGAWDLEVQRVMPSQIGGSERATITKTKAGES